MTKKQQEKTHRLHMELRMDLWKWINREAIRRDITLKEVVEDALSLAKTQKTKD